MAEERQNDLQSMDDSCDNCMHLEVNWHVVDVTATLEPLSDASLSVNSSLHICDSELMDKDWPVQSLSQTLALRRD
jgi:hypothetical protein